MNVVTSRRKILAVAAMSAGLTLVPAAAFASPAQRSLTALPTPATATTVPPAAATTTTTTPKSTTSTTKTTISYEVIAGTFKTKAGADKRLAAITAKQISGLAVVKIGKTAHTTRYRIEVKGLTKTDAKAMVKSLRADKFFAFFTRG
jgi:cell division protein FtsN